MSDFKNPSRGEVVLDQIPDGNVELDVQLEDETLWRNLNQLSELLGCDKSVVSRHLRQRERWMARNKRPKHQRRLQALRGRPKVSKGHAHYGAKLGEITSMRPTRPIHGLQRPRPPRNRPI